MPSYNWRDQPQEVTNRFPDWVLGLESWRRFVNVLSEFAGRLGNRDGEAFRIVVDAYRRFVDETDAQAPRVRDCRVFVSHQRDDIKYAERLAWIADREGFEYWLDVHDPQLKAANSATLSGPAKAFAIAAIIEIALLNCSHVIGAQTTNSRKSRWVPYEFGRGKYPVLASLQAASWFEPGVTLDPDGDYLSLGRQTYSEGDVTTWLRDERKRNACNPKPRAWQRDEPPSLPKP